MPCRVFAAPTYQVDELTALPMQRDMESFTLPTLAEADNELELALDFQDRKHVDTSEEGDEVYTLQDDVSSSHTKFTMAGQASADALRDYLAEHLPPHQVVDEYGDGCDLSDISNDHLVVLQAKMWTKVSNARSLIKAITPHPSRVQILIAGHIAKIAQLLEEKHLFVLSNTGHDTCHYLDDLQDNTTHVCRSQIVRIEPLVHWGTVTLATASKFIVAFRRDGGLIQVPVYKQLVRRLVDTTAPTYCVDCLGHLWTKRGEARDIMRQLQDAVPPLQLRSSGGAAQIHTQQPFRNPGFTASNASVLGVSVISSLAAYQNKPAETETHGGDIGMTPFQLDGTSDYASDTRHHRSSSNTNQGYSAVWEELDSDENAGEHCEDTDPLSCSSSFTLPLRTTPQSSNERPTRNTPPSPSRTLSSTTTKVANAPKKTQTKGAVTTNKYGFRKVQTTPLRITERKFGRELDTNSTIPPAHVRRSPRNYMKEASMSQETFSSNPVRPMKLLKPLKKTMDLTKETEKRKTALTGHQTGKQKKARTIASKGPELGQPKLRANSTAGLRYSPEPESVIRPPSPPKLTAHFAKRPILPDMPEGITTLTYEAYQNVHPAPTSKICVCNKPASHGTFKKGELPQVAQCMNRDCHFRWYHYACLNQSDKGKARWGTLICQHCRNVEEFAKQDKRNGWNMARHMDFRTNWTKEDIEAEMPGLGGHGPVANPYGLGIEIKGGPAYNPETQTKGTLGELGKFGYAQSHPHMLEEAYSSPNAYAGLRAELAQNEADDNEGWYENMCD